MFGSAPVALIELDGEGKFSSFSTLSAFSVRSTGGNEEGMGAVGGEDCSWLVSLTSRDILRFLLTCNGVSTMNECREEHPGLTEERRVMRCDRLDFTEEGGLLQIVSH